MGDYVIVINAETMHLDSWALGHPKYRAYSPGRPGSLIKNVFRKNSTANYRKCGYKHVTKWFATKIL